TAASAPGVPASITTRPTTRSSVRANGAASGTQHSRPPTCFDSSKQVMLIRTASLRPSAPPAPPLLKVGAPADLGARRPHLLQRPLAVALLDVDGADAVLQHDHLEAVLPRVQHGGAHAVVGGQPGHVQPADLSLPQPLRQPG